MRSQVGSIASTCGPWLRARSTAGHHNLVDELFEGRVPQVTGAPVGRAAFSTIVAEGGYPEARRRPAGRVRERWFANYVALAPSRAI